MAGPLDYRSGRPDLSSSSPLANMTELSSSDPISPGSPTPAYRRLSSHQGDKFTASSSSSTTLRPSTFLSPNNSHPDPFSANAKASPNSHPSFGVGELRAKHLRKSSQQSQLLQAGAITWIARGGAGTECVDDRQRQRHSSNSLIGGGRDVLAQHFFDSSDDNPSSDEPSMFSMTQGTSVDSVSSMKGSSGRRTGLGIDDASFGADAEDELSGSRVLGEPFREPTSPTLLGKKLRARKFERTQSSSHDPFSAVGGSSTRHTPVLGYDSPRSQPTSQRRRLTGTSPKKLSRVTSSGQFPSIYSNGSDSEESGPGRAAGPNIPHVDMHEEVNRIFSDPKLHGKMLLDGKGVTSIDPVIADLSKYVSFPASSFLRDDDVTSSITRHSSFSRTSSLSNASDHFAGQSTAAGSSPTRSRSGNHIKVHSSEGLQLYLANNRLKALPSALFSATNITMLTLRNNSMEELPAAIGVLSNLRELNLSGCGLRYLPAEIQQLRLTTFTYFPNPFIRPPDGERLMVRLKYGHRRRKQSLAEQAKAVAVDIGNDEMAQLNDPRSPAATDEVVSMGPPALPMRVRATAQHFAGRTSFALAGTTAYRTTESVRHDSHEEGRGGSVVGRVLGTRMSDESNVSRRLLPTLQELCIRRLLRPEGTKGYNGQTSTNTLLECYEAGSLSRLRCHLSADIVKTLEAARRSACGVWGQMRPASSHQDTWCSGGSTYVVPHKSAILRSGRRSDKMTTNGSEADDVDMSADRRTDSRTFDRGGGGQVHQSDDREWDVDEGEASGELSTDDEPGPRMRRAVDVEHDLDKGDDARSNPWFNRCPNPRHTHQQDAAAPPSLNADGGRTVPIETAEHNDDNDDNARDWPRDANAARLFCKPGVERIEWVTHVAGLKVASVAVSADMLGVTDEKQRIPACESKCLPLLWRGCGADCLDFLEDI